MTGWSSTCERARAWASAAADGEISDLEAISLHSHLDGCPACAAYSVELDWLLRELRSAPLHEPARPLFQPRERAARRRPLRSLQYAAAAAAVIGAVGLGHLAATLGSARTGGGPTAAAIASTRPAPFEQALLAMAARQLHGRAIPA
jgi:predicted anti-sigma-YlaC factor YlaD